MQEFLIEIRLPEIFSGHFISLIPKQRDTVNRMMLNGKILSYALSLESRKLWITMLADSEETAENYLKDFPVYEYINYAIHKLTFHNNVKLSLPQFSLN